MTTELDAVFPFWGATPPSDLTDLPAPEEGSVFLPSLHQLLATANVFEAAVAGARGDRGLYVRSQQLFLGAMFLVDEIERGDAFFAHIPPDGLSTRVLVWHHDENAFTDAITEDIPTFDALWARFDGASAEIEPAALEEEQRPPVPRASLAALDDRAAWIHPVLFEGRFDANLYSPEQDGLSMAPAAVDKLATFAPTGLYWLWRSFLLDERAQCQMILGKLESSPSRLLRDAARTVGELLAGRADLVGVDLGAARAAIAARPRSQLAARAPAPSASAPSLPPDLPTLAISTAAVSAPTPPDFCRQQIESLHATYRGATAQGRVPCSANMRFFWFEPGATEERSAQGLPEGRAIVVDVHPSREACLVEVGPYLDNMLWEVDLGSGAARPLLTEPRGLSGAYVGEHHLATAAKKVVALWKLGQTPEPLASTDTGVFGRVEGFGSADLVLQADMNGGRGVLLRADGDRLVPLGYCDAGYDRPFLCDGGLHLAPSHPDDPVRRVSVP